jgi:ATP-dependent DNA helicase RecG
MQPSDLITKHFRLIDTQKSALSRLGLITVRDMLYYFPFRYDIAGDESSVSALQPGQEVSLIGTLEKLEIRKSWKRKIPVSEGYLRDQSGRVKMMWFNQPYIAKLYQDGTLVKATGKVTGSGEKIYLANPRLERVSATDAGLFKEPQINLLEKSGLPSSGEARTGDPRTFSGDLFAVYPETRGVTSLWFRHAIAKVMNSGVLNEIKDGVPEELLRRYNLPTLRTALVWIHTPQTAKDAEAARKRFAFEEVF